jgi:hypothetical protein
VPPCPQMCGRNLPQHPRLLVATEAAEGEVLTGRRRRLGVGMGWTSIEPAAMGQDVHLWGRLSKSRSLCCGPRRMRCKICSMHDICQLSAGAWDGFAKVRCPAHGGSASAGGLGDARRVGQQVMKRSSLHTRHGSRLCDAPCPRQSEFMAPAKGRRAGKRHRHRGVSDRHHTILKWPA